MNAEKLYFTDELFDRLGLLTRKTLPSTIADGNTVDCRCSTVEIQ